MCLNIYNLKIKYTFGLYLLTIGHIGGYYSGRILCRGDIVRGVTELWGFVWGDIVQGVGLSRRFFSKNNILHMCHIC